MAKVLIIEDNLAELTLAKLLLERAGHTSISATNAETGMAMAGLERPDLILMDVYLPGMDGLSATRILKQNHVTAGIPIVMITSMGVEEYQQKASGAPCDGWIAKPLGYQELTQVIEDTLGQAGNSAALEAAEPRSVASILVAGGQDEDRHALSQALETEGYCVIGVGSCEEVLKMAGTLAPDLILIGAGALDKEGPTVAGDTKPNAVGAAKTVRAPLANGKASLVGLCGEEKPAATPIDRAELWLHVRNLRRVKEYNDFLQSHGSILESEVQRRTAELYRFRTAMDAADEAILLLDCATGHFVEVNTTACNMLGYTRHDLFGMAPPDLGGDIFSQLGKSPGEWAEQDGRGMAKESILVRPDGTHLQVEIHQHVQVAGEDRIVVVVMRDITERKEAEDRLHHMARYDPLTGLANRTFFYGNLEKTLAFAESISEEVAVIFIDLDYFKNVNDAMGHAVGDELLHQFADRLQECLRARDVAGRMGGDEFVISVTAKNGQMAAMKVIAKIQKSLQTSFSISGQEITLSASFGVAVYPRDTTLPQDLLKYADKAMYEAKHAGRDAVRFFTAQMSEEAAARLELEKALRQAVANQEFVLHYQPKGDLRTGRIVGVEALIRWERPGQGLVMPGGFIGVLEEMGLIRVVGQWVIGEACAQVARWLKNGVGSLPVAVNVSPLQFSGEKLNSQISEALLTHNIPAELLEIELTETCMMVNSTRTVAILESLKNLGVKISIDDFGTGYSSLAYLRNFPVDKLKIDISFVRDLALPNNGTIALTIIQLAKNLHMEAIAEGVETQAQFAYLRVHHCDQVQGYYLSRPVAAEVLEQRLKEKGYHFFDPEGIGETVGVAWAA